MQCDEAKAVKWIPNWLHFYVFFGLSGLSKRRQRKQLAANIVALLGTITSFSYVFFYLSYDVGLWPVATAAALNGIHIFVLPFTYRANRSFGALTVVLLSVTLFLVITYFVGISAGILFYIFVIPPAAVVLLGPAWIWHLVLTSSVSALAVLLAMTYMLEPALQAARDPYLQSMLLVSSVFSTAFLLPVTGYVALLWAENAEQMLEAEHARSEALLYNLLPEDIAARLKTEPGKTIADNLPQVAILFADIVDFTPRAASLPPEQVVGFLNRIFSTFDELAEKHGLEKIKTIGDAYMVAAGMPSQVGDPVHRIAEMALDMQRATNAMSPDFSEGLQVRIGLHAGPAVAGVIGNKKPFYDVWGETVNTASRMESHGEPGRIQVTKAAKEELEGDYYFEPRGTVEVKGMGTAETWWLSSSPPSA